MSSQWLALKSEAIRMRTRGASIRDVEAKLGIPRSTLSGWFKHLKLSEYHQKVLRKKAARAIIRARVEAVKWHNLQKTLRMKLAAEDAARTLNNIDFTNSAIVELALAILYLGEGTKKTAQTAMGNSDPLILRFFVRTIQKLYSLTPTDFKCHLHLRADQDPEKMARYWSRELGIPRRNFLKPLIDQRTFGSPTYPHYKGVCAITCQRVAIQRKLMYIAIEFCKKIVD